MSLRFSCIVVVALAMIAGPAIAQQPKAADPKASSTAKMGTKGPEHPDVAPSVAVPPPEVLLALIRSALIALDHANRTDNYTVLRELGGPVLERHSSAQLRAIFANLRREKVDLLPVTIVTPQLTQPPSVSAKGVLQIVGYFPTRPRQINFHIVYQPVAGRWRLFGLNVSLRAVPAAAAAHEPKGAEEKSGPARAGPAAKKK